MTTRDDSDWAEAPTTVGARKLEPSGDTRFPDRGESVIQAPERVREQAAPGEFPPLPEAARAPLQTMAHACGEAGQSGFERPNPPAPATDRETHEFLAATRGTSVEHKCIPPHDKPLDLNAALRPDLELSDADDAFINLDDPDEHFDLSTSGFDLDSGLGLAESAFDTAPKAPLAPLPHAPNLSDVIAAIDQHGFATPKADAQQDNPTFFGVDAAEGSDWPED